MLKLKKIFFKSLRKNTIYMLLTAITQLAFSVGGIEILTNTTPSSGANPAQQAAISPEAVFYNPAGSAFLEEGHHLHYGAYVVGIDYQTRVDSLKFDTNDPQTIPSFSYIYKKNRSAYYLGFGAMGQGGILEYNISNPAIEDFNATIIHMGGIFGFSHMIDDNISLSLGGRYLYSRISTDGKTSLGNEFDSRIDAWGIAPEIGMHLKITEKLDFAAKYLGETSLSYDGKVKKGNPVIVEALFGKYSTDHRKNFPAVFSLGTAYELNEYQKIYLGYNWIFESDKDTDEEYYGKYKDSYEYSASFEQYLNEKFDLILGYSYGDRGKNDKDIIDITELSFHQIGAGIRYKKSQNTDITLGLGSIFYESENSEVLGQNIKSSRKEFLFGVSVNTKL